MRGLLQKLPTSRLLKLVGRRALSEVERTIGSPLADEPAVLSDILIGLFGQDILTRRDVRAAVLSTIEGTELRTLTQHVCGTSFNAPADNATLLSSEPWTAESPIVDAMRAVLGVSAEYLPRADYAHPTIEVLEPIGRLPPLHEYQRSVLREVLDCICDAGSATLVQMPTGSGKTRTAVQSLLRADQAHGWLDEGGAILWLAHSEELCEQAISAFRKVWLALAERDTQIVRLWSGHRAREEQILGSIVVGTYQTLSSICESDTPFFKRLRESVRCVVADEAHMALAPTFRRALTAVRTDRSILLGLTATPGRSVDADRENKQLAALFDARLIVPREFGDNAINYLRCAQVLSRVSRVVVETGIRIDDSVSPQTQLDLPSRVLKRLATSRARNRVIAKTLCDEVDHKRQTLVFTCGVEHSRFLTAALLAKNVPAAFVDSTVTRQRRRSLVKDFASRKLSVLMNFGVLSAGFDAPGVNTVVITRPTASVVLYSQMVGRGLRGPKMGGSTECRLIDVRDNFTRFGGVESVYDVFRDYWAS